MAVIFGIAKAVAAASVVDNVFARPAVVFDETEADAASASGQVRVVTNYRGFTKAGPGRKNTLLGQTVVDLAPVSMIALSDLTNLIARLSTLQEELAGAGVGESEG